MSADTTPSTISSTGPVPPVGARPRSRAGLGIVVTLTVLAAVIAGAVAGVMHFIDQERARELRTWQTRLAIVADSRAGAVARWFAERVAGELGELAANESLQIYVTELATGGADAALTGGAAQTTYLRNLLLVTAGRGGFDVPPSSRPVGANVRPLGIAGIGVYGMDGRVLVATSGMPPLEGALRRFFDGLSPGAGEVFDIARNDHGSVGLGYAAPVYRIQGSGAPSEQVGWVVGIKPVGDELFGLLAQPGEVNATAENFLVRHNPPLVEYISPLADGSKPLDRAFADATAGLAAVEAVARPGGFASLRDYRERDVLAVSRPVAGLPWVLVSKVDRAEALGASDARLRRALIIALLAIGLGAAAIAALWRHGASRRAAITAEKHAEIARRFESQSSLLRLVTDSQPGMILIVDTDGRVGFANEAAGARAGVASGDMVGKGLAALLGPAEAKPRMALARQALEEHRRLSDTLTGDDGRVMQGSYVPLPADATRAVPAVLVVENDVSEAVTERARRERTLNQLVRTLMTVVDKRDPYAAHQSERTSALARAVAEEMQVDAVSAQTAEIAGNLMTLGKILVPSEMLTRSANLSADEMQQIRESLQASADLVADIEFDGPVVETLRQIRERWDGGGPDGLAGEEIVLPARIVAVANTFVAIVSHRAWRAGASVNDAVAAMMGDAGTAFDRRVVVALVNYLENRGGRAEWEARLADAG